MSKSYFYAPFIDGRKGVLNEPLFNKESIRWFQDASFESPYITVVYCVCFMCIFMTHQLSIRHMCDVYTHQNDGGFYESFSE